MDKIKPCLWFDTQGEDAARFYTSIFKNSSIGTISRYTEAGPLPAGTSMTVEFELDGAPFLALNGGPVFTFNEAVSLTVTCADQAEVDYFWNALSEGGNEGECGWLRDKYGLFWQIVPAELPEILMNPDQEKAARAMKAMFTMRKLDIAALRSAADNG